MYDTRERASTGSAPTAGGVSPAPPARRTASDPTAGDEARPLLPTQAAAGRPAVGDQLSMFDEAEVGREPAGDGDYYPTPADAIDALMPHLGPLRGSLLEPCAGDGHLLARLLPHHAGPLTVCEERLCCQGMLARLVSHLPHELLCPCDALYAARQWRRDERTFDHILMNSPFSGDAWERWVLAMRPLVAPGGRLVCLGRDDHMYGQHRQRDIYAGQPWDYYPITWRLSFIGGGGASWWACWYVWPGTGRLVRLERP